MKRALIFPGVIKSAIESAPKPQTARFMLTIATVGSSIWPFMAG